MIPIDPTTALAELRALMYIAQTLLDGGEVGDIEANHQAIVDTFNGLDNWLSNGGFLPEAWAR